MRSDEKPKSKIVWKKSTALPDDFPKDVPIYPNAKLDAAVWGKGLPSEDGAFVAWKTQDEIQVVRHFLTEKLDAWKESARQTLRDTVDRGQLKQGLEQQRAKLEDLVERMRRTVTEAERRHVAQDLVASQLDVARLAALRGGFEAATIPRELVAPAGASDADLARTKSSMRAQAAEQLAKLASINR